MHSISASRQAAAYLTADVEIAVILRDGDQCIEALHSLMERTDFLDSEIGQRLLIQSELTVARLMLEGLATSAQTDAWSALAAMLGRDLAIGIALGEGGTRHVLVAVVARDPALVDRLLARVHAMTGLVVDGKPDETRSHVVDGVCVFTATPDFHHCRIDDALVLSNDKAMLEASLRVARHGEISLAASKPFRRAERRIPANATAWVLVDAARLRRNLREEEKLPPKMDDAGACLLLGGWRQVVKQTDETLIWLTPTGDTLRIEASATTPEPLPASHAAFMPVSGDAAAWHGTDLPGFIAEWRISRRWADGYAARGVLMTPTAAAALADFGKTVSVMPGGMDFGEELLPRFDATAHLIAVQRDSSDGPNASPRRLPDFALVLPLRTPRRPDADRRLLDATNKAIAASITEAAHPPASAPSESQGNFLADFRRHLQPAAAIVEGQVVLATSPDLLRDIIDTIADGKGTPDKTKGPPPPGLGDHLYVDVQSLVGILAAHRTELIAHRMRAADRSKGLATRDVNGLFMVLDLVDHVSLWSRPGEKDWRAGLEIGLRDGGNTSGEAVRP